MQNALLNNSSSLNQRKYPHYIKYMGSKSKIMDFVIDGINEVYNGGAVCDLFAGSASLSGAIGNQVSIHSNDIQQYSSILSAAYLLDYKSDNIEFIDALIDKASKIVSNKESILKTHYDYSRELTLDEFQHLENSQREFLYLNYECSWHLFTMYYSGTWWSAEQCLWIDALREVIDSYKGSSIYATLLSSLMYAMAYTSQGTGHYAQYRDANTYSSMKDILIYRKRNIADYFRKKMLDVYSFLPVSKSNFEHTITALDYDECLKIFSGGTIYADPPYCFVHYSRFYHILETVVRYDYPSIQQAKGDFVKGRYRDDRHQSPFCIKTQVYEAFKKLFLGVRLSGSNLVLSYSNSGMLSIKDLEQLASEVFFDKSISLLTKDHKHMTLGRLKDSHRDVEECLLLVK